MSTTSQTARARPRALADPGLLAELRSSGHHVVLGAPGSGRTTVAVDLVAQAVREGGSNDVLLLSPTRRQAARSRHALSSRLAGTLGHVVARTPASFAFSLAQARARLLGGPPPALITGADQDQILADLLAGHAAGEGTSVRWPASVPEEARALRAFRAELRDVLMRAAEAGWDAVELADRGRAMGRPEWVACAQVLDEYEDVTRLMAMTPDRGPRYDVATIVDEAARLLREWETDLPGQPRPRWRLVVHDDYQEATLATARLVRALADDGAQLVLLGDPDCAVQTFRGGVPTLLAEASSPPGLAHVGAFGARRHVLDGVWRGGPRLRGLVSAAASSLPTAVGARHRRALAPEAGAPESIRVLLAGSAAQEVRAIARAIRERRLRESVPYSQMAVIVRGSAQASAIRRGLRLAGLPIATAASEAPLREAPVVRAMLLALAVVDEAGSADSGEGAGAPCSPAQAVELLCSPLIGLDAVGVRRLRRALRREELAGGGARGSDELLAEAVVDPDFIATLPPRVREAPRRLARALARGMEERRRPGASVETVLWAMWNGIGVAEDWRRVAMGSGSAAERADADLDAAVALFRAAEQFVVSARGAGVPDFLAYLQGQEVASDTLAAHGRREDAVAILTAAGAAGQEWELVVVAGVQEDVWPDVRLRDTMLGAGAISDVALGRDVARPLAQARSEVRHDELRAFIGAISRATRVLVVTAVNDGDHRPSPFVRLVETYVDVEHVPGAGSDAAALAMPTSGALDLRGLAGELRAELLRERPDPAAASILAELARRGVAGADPQSWRGARQRSTDEPLWGPEETVPISPSHVESAQACPLRWALTSSGGEASDSGAQRLGVLVHAIAAELPHGTEEELLAALDERWPELGAGDTWVGRGERARAEQFLRRLASYHAGVPGLVEVEVGFEAQIGRALLRGRVDRLEVVGDDPEGRRLRVVDLKTGASMASLSEAESHPQLGSYQAAVRAGGFGPAESDGARLAYLARGAASATLRSQSALPADPDQDWTSQMLATTVETMAASEFAAIVGKGCRVCPVARSCPAQAEGSQVVE